MENLIRNDYLFENREYNDIVSALGYLGFLICNVDVNKEESSDLAKVPMETIRDTVIKFHKYLGYSTKSTNTL